MLICMYWWHVIIFLVFFFFIWYLSRVFFWNFNLYNLYFFVFLFIQEAISYLGSLDYLILNHAYLLTTQKEITAWKGTDDDHQRLKYSFDVNFLSYVKTADVAMPYLKNTNGSICVVSSMISKSVGISKHFISIFCSIT